MNLVGRCLLKQRMMEVVSGDNLTTGTISLAKLQSNHHHQQTNIQFFYRPDALPVAQPTVSEHWRENITFHGLAYLKLTWGLPTVSLTTNSSWLPWGRVAISPLMPVPQGTMTAYGNHRQTRDHVGKRIFSTCGLEVVFRCQEACREPVGSGSCKTVTLRALYACVSLLKTASEALTTWQWHWTCACICWECNMLLSVGLLQPVELLR